MPCSACEWCASLPSTVRSSAKPLKMPQRPLFPVWQFSTVTNCETATRMPARVRPSTMKPSITTWAAPSTLMPSGVVPLSAMTRRFLPWVGRLR